MNIQALVPRPKSKRRFHRSSQRFVADRAGCYVLTTFGDVVLYVGLTDDLRRRIGEHLDDPKKIAETLLGRAFWFHWLETMDLNKIERTWMNIHIENEGSLPELNGIYSPTFT